MKARGGEEGHTVDLPRAAWTWNCHIEKSMASWSGRPVSSRVSTASLQREIRLPGPISL